MLCSHDGLNNPIPRPPRWPRPCSLHTAAVVVAVSMLAASLLVEAGCVVCEVFIEPALAGHAAAGTRTHAKPPSVAPPRKVEQSPDWHCLLWVQPAMSCRRAPRHAQQQFRQANPTHRGRRTQGHKHMHARAHPHTKINTH